MYYYKYIVDGTWTVDPVAPKVRQVPGRALGTEWSGARSATGRGEMLLRAMAGGPHGVIDKAPRDALRAPYIRT